MSAKEIVMRDSPEAATYRTDIKGWVSRDGIFYGDGPSGEATARYAGCTHAACRDCGTPTEKHYLLCRGCRDVADEKRYDAMPQATWDGKAMVYSQTLDRYYNEPSDAEDDLEAGQTLADLRLVICTPNYVRPLESDYCSDDLSEDGDLPPDVEDAMNAFNEAVAGIVLSWSPGKTRLALDESAGSVPHGEGQHG